MIFIQVRINLVFAHKLWRRRSEKTRREVSARREGRTELGRGPGRPASLHRATLGPLPQFPRHHSPSAIDPARSREWAIRVSRRSEIYRVITLEIRRVVGAGSVGRAGGFGAGAQGGRARAGGAGSPAPGAARGGCTLSAGRMSAPPC